MNEMKQHVHNCLGTYFHDTHGEQCKPTTFALAAKRFRAIDLSCRACDACGAGAGCWAWIPVRGAFGFAPPNSDHLWGRSPFQGRPRQGRRKSQNRLERALFRKFGACTQTLEQ